MDNLRISSLNCHGVKERKDTLVEVCSRSDLVAVQEHWLTPDELPLLSSIHPEFRAHGISAMDPGDGLLQGRPYGGVAFLWRKDLDLSLKVVKTDNNRVCAVRVSHSGSEILVICVYCPYFTPENTDEFIDTLGYIYSLITEYDICNTFVVGYFNSNPGSGFWDELKRMGYDNLRLCYFA